MELNKADSGKSLEGFSRDLFEELQKHPFGSMPKRDLDCLLFFLFEKHGLLKGKTNREKAQNLQINETRLKSYILDANAKYGTDKKTENLAKLLKKMGDDTKVAIDGDYLVFLEEDPVVKADFVQSLKDEGFYTDSSFNNELIKVKLSSFLCFAKNKNLLNNKKLLDIVKSDEKSTKLIKKFIDEDTNLKEMALGILKIIQAQNGFGISTFISLFEYGKDIFTAKISGEK
ncbi:hypothetical protein HO345_05230 [Treponema denticola]|uniref:hypothetical protein n=1 Tax=Treponema denticola TaxID=158 RepID=UPI0020A4823F|nr:hypothetical protein [Treponema denticola]UTD12419.1 hypothetical protein HO345_05230 [Treponema denticola]